jgi:hypothetical protein
MAKLKTLEQLTLEQTGEAYALTLQIKGEGPLSVTLSPDLLHAFVDAALNVMGDDARSALDRDDGNVDPWTDGP